MTTKQRQLNREKQARNAHKYLDYRAFWQLRKNNEARKLIVKKQAQDLKALAGQMIKIANSIIRQNKEVNYKKKYEA